MTDRAIEQRSPRGWRPKGRRVDGDRSNVPRVAAILSQRNPGGYDHQFDNEREELPHNVRTFRSDCATIAEGDSRAVPQAEATESGR
jgi:hypothetical protein